MKKFLFIIFLASATYINAQDDQPAGRLYGRILDAATNKGIEAASVQLIEETGDSTSGTKKDSLIDGMLTLPNGDFSLNNIPGNKKYKLLITAIGFQTYENTVPLSRNFSDKDLGNIKLKIDPQLLQSVTVTSTRPMMSLGIDRKVFNVDKSLTSIGGTDGQYAIRLPAL